MLLKTFGTYRILCKKFGRSRSLPKVRIFKNSAPKPKFGRTLKRTTPTGGLFLGRVSFYAFKIDFRYLAVRKSIISGVYWL